MINKDFIKNLVEQKISGTGIFIVDITVGKGYKIFIRVDKKNGITLEECENISRFVEQNLDRDKQDFELEVSSPGIGEPFKVILQFYKNIGKTVSVITKDSGKKTGTLIAVNDTEIEIEAEEKQPFGFPINHFDPSTGSRLNGLWATNQGRKTEYSKKKKLVKNNYKFPINSITVKEVVSFK
ncbi:MAG: ribosome assembly cofactor RimP [Bacteroidia bacterium]|nr:ribosome assembly cofactor RimP [Bacteroidia bacterium]